MNTIFSIFFAVVSVIPVLVLIFLVREFREAKNEDGGLCECEIVMMAVIAAILVSESAGLGWAAFYFWDKG
jgi:hypothetical protein